MTSRRTAAAVAAFLLSSAAAAGAQEAAAPLVSAEAVASASWTSGAAHVSGMLDGTATIRLGHGLIGIARPWAWRRPDGTSTFQWYQLQLRYQTRTAIPVRVDAGVITSPIGLNTLQMRADLNPFTSAVPYYVVPLPAFERRFDGVRPISAGYPLGVVVGTSGTWWDARGGITDSSPARPRAPLESDQPDPMAQTILGGGLSPIAGLRVGAGFAHGQYRKPTPTFAGGTATVLNLEGEFTINQTRLSGEWVVDRFSGTTGLQIAKSFFVQGVQDITPRLYGGARVSHIETPNVFVAGRATTRSTAEVTAGLRVTRSVTVRAGYLQQRPYFGEWSHEAAFSLVWVGRWWR